MLSYIGKALTVFCKPLACDAKTTLICRLTLCRRVGFGTHQVHE
jgi:hypothetical protein